MSHNDIALWNDVIVWSNLSFKKSASTSVILGFCYTPTIVSGIPTDGITFQWIVLYVDVAGVLQRNGQRPSDPPRFLLGEGLSTFNILKF